MVSPSHCAKGQSVIELTFALGVVALLLFWSIQLILFERGGFGHHYLESADRRNDPTPQMAHIYYKGGIAYIGLFKESRISGTCHGRPNILFLKKVRTCVCVSSTGC